MFIFGGKGYLGASSSQVQLASGVLWALSASFGALYILSLFLHFSFVDFLNVSLYNIIFLVPFLAYVLTKSRIKQQTLGYLGVSPFFIIGISRIGSLLLSLLQLAVGLSNTFTILCVITVGIVIIFLWFRKSRPSSAFFWFLSTLGIMEIARGTDEIGLDLSYYIFSLIAFTCLLLVIDWRRSVRFRSLYLTIFLPFPIIGVINISSVFPKPQQIGLFITFILVLALLFYIGIRSSVVLAIALSTVLGVFGYRLIVVYLSYYISWLLAYSLTLPFFAILVYRYTFESVVFLSPVVKQTSSTPISTSFTQPSISKQPTSPQTITPRPPFVTKPALSTTSQVKAFRWPAIQEYVEACQNLAIHMIDPELKKGSVELDKSGFPKVLSGNFACVFKVRCEDQIYAIRCFYNSRIADLEKRYRAISDTLKTVNLPFFVKFVYLPDGIRVGGKEYPILKMEWAEGELLNRFIEKNLKNKSLLLRVANEFAECIVTMQKNKIAHGDLQHGNIKVCVNKQANLVKIYFVDYDGLYVPNISSNKSPELGHPNYQHPRRNENHYDYRLDNFSALVIYLSIVAIAENPELWNRYHDDECIIFTKRDFENPQQSKLIQELLRSPCDKIRKLTKLLEEALLSDPLSNKIRPEYFYDN